MNTLILGYNGHDLEGSSLSHDFDMQVLNLEYPTLSDKMQNQRSGGSAHEKSTADMSNTIGCGIGIG